MTLKLKKVTFYQIMFRKNIDIREKNRIFAFYSSKLNIPLMNITY